MPKKKKPIGPLLPNEMMVLGYLRRFIADKQYAPTFAEICADVGLSSRSGASRALDRLEGRGLIKRVQQQARSIEITAAGHAEKLPEKVA